MTMQGYEALKAEPLAENVIGIDDFSKVDLRVARVLSAEDVPQAKKLLKLVLGLGGDVRRTAAEFARFSKHDGEIYPQFDAWLNEAANVVRKLLLDTPVDPSRRVST